MNIFGLSNEGSYFSKNIPDAVINIRGYDRAVVTISIPEFGEVYNQILYPDASGNITLTELGEMLTPYAKKRSYIMVEMECTEQTVAQGYAQVVTDGTTGVVEFEVLYCAADIGDNAKAFYEGYFLSMLSGPKLTAPGRMELLSMIHHGEEYQAQAHRVFTDGTTDVVDITGMSGDGHYCTFDVSPDKILGDSARPLASYTIRCGDRQQQYDIDFLPRETAPILAFYNSFGVEEMIYCTGRHQVSPDFKRNTSFVDGKLRNIEIQEVRTFKADTGILNKAMADWLDELFRSDYVRIVNVYDGNYSFGREVIISESKSDNSNDADALPRFTFSYRYAQKTQAVFDTYRKGRIFDNTFDQTFN